MNISKIELKGYNQFKNVELNLVYPKGHTEEGKPLKKICLIGQSGTGKTSILRLIKYFVARNRIIGKDFLMPMPKTGSVVMELNQGNLFSRESTGGKGFYVDRLLYEGSKITFEKYIELSEKYKKNKTPLIINYPAEVIRGNPNTKIPDDVTERAKKVQQKLDSIGELSPKKVIDFALEEIEEIRNFVFKEIKEHRALELLHKNEIANSVIKEGIKPADITRLNRKYEKWLLSNPNPLEKLANECLDPILNQFGLRVKTKIDLDTILALGDIQLETLLGQEVDRPFWSTGTRHIVDTALPLFELKPKEAVILMDEPEKSLYPDIQEGLIDFYTGLAPSCQFFFATHSHIVASAFDPWEVFHLEYDDSNKSVKLEKNYKGERHIDNYEYYPKYLKWDSLLMRMFKVTAEGNDKRDDFLIKVAETEDKLNEMIKAKKQNTKAFKTLKDDFFKMKKKVGWDETN